LASGLDVARITGAGVVVIAGGVVGIMVAAVQSFIAGICSAADPIAAIARGACLAASARTGVCRSAKQAVIARIRVVRVSAPRHGIAAVGGADIVVVAIQRSSGEAAIGGHITGFRTVTNIVVIAVCIRGAAGFAFRNAGIARSGS